MNRSYEGAIANAAGKYLDAPRRYDLIEVFIVAEHRGIVRITENVVGHMPALDNRFERAILDRCRNMSDADFERSLGRIRRRPGGIPAYGGDAV
jgi:hypothetical protein